MKLLPLFLFIIFLFLLVDPIMAFVQINEVMYNPQGADNNKEFIELYTSELVNLTNYTLADSSSQDHLELLQLTNSSYILIVEESFNYTEINASIYSAGATIGNNLGNNGDSILLKDQNGEIITTLTYNSSLGAEGNGKTLCLYNASWQECLATAGHKNEIEDETNQIELPKEAEETRKISLSVYLEDKVYTGEKYTRLFKLKIKDKDNCAEKDNIVVAYNITNSDYLIKTDQFNKEIGCSGYSSTGEFIPTVPGNYVLCGKVILSTLNETTPSVCQDFIVIDTASIPCNISLNISIKEKEIYNESESIKFKIELNEKSFPFTIEYWIEDLLGKIVRNKINTTNTNQKSWKSNIDEEDRILLFKSVVYPTCNDTNLTDNSREKMFFVVNPSQEPVSSINIEKLYLGTDDKVDWGDQFTVKVNIYKGDETKQSVQLWAEKEGERVSKTTKVNIYDKYKSYPLTLPIQLEANCNQKISDGKATLILEAFGMRTEKEFKIEDVDKDICKDYLSYVKEIEKEQKQQAASAAYQLVDLPLSLFSGEATILKLQLLNDDIFHDYEVWSYLYRGSKCYSCRESTVEREVNKRIIPLNKNEIKVVELPLLVDVSAEEGEYKIKVKIRKDGQKTVKEITQSIQVVVKLAENSITLEKSDQASTFLVGDLPASESQQFPFSQRKELLSEREGIVVYESSSQKAKKLIPTILSITFALLCIVLIMKK